MLRDDAYDMLILDVDTLLTSMGLESCRKSGLSQTCCYSSHGSRQGGRPRLAAWRSEPTTTSSTRSIPRDLVARVNAVMRRYSSGGGGKEKPAIVRGKLTLNLTNSEIILRDKKTNSHPTEAKLLYVLMDSRKRPSAANASPARSRQASRCGRWWTKPSTNPPGGRGSVSAAGCGVRDRRYHGEPDAAARARPQGSRWCLSATSARARSACASACASPRRAAAPSTADGRSRRPRSGRSPPRSGRRTAHRPGRCRRYRAR